MLKKKTKKKLKKLQARLRMRRLQILMESIRIHKKITKNIKARSSHKKGHDLPLVKHTQKPTDRIKTLKGKVASARTRSRDRWLSIR